MDNFIRHNNGLVVVDTSIKYGKVVNTTTVVVDSNNNIKNPIEGTELVEIKYCDMIFQIAKLNSNKGDFINIIGDVVLNENKEKLLRVYEINNYSVGNKVKFTSFNERYANVLDHALMKLSSNLQ